MDKFLFFIKIAVFVEITLIALLLLLNYAAKVYFLFKEKNQKKQKENIENQLTELGKKKSIINDNTVKYLSSYISLLLTIIPLLKDRQLPFWDHLLQQLSEKVLKPGARKLACSRNWFKRYLAVNCFNYGFDPIDERLLSFFIADSSLLVSLNASRVALQYPTSGLINKIIDVYSKGRRLQQSSFAEILTEKNPSLIRDAAAERLVNEPDPYVKIFCYRLLNKLPPTNIIPSIERDITSENLDLKIAVLNYLAHIRRADATEEIRFYLTDPHWQIRAVSAKLAGQLKDKMAIPALNQCLQDSEWWVRINAAQALSALGNEGRMVLEAQDPDIDRYAYEAAQQVLTVLKK